MRFYTRQHRHYCGVDLHARSMYVCILDAEGTMLVSKNISASPEPFLALIGPYREDLAVAAECMFTWYWLADLCERERIAFVLGHALYMRAIHGGKAKNDRIDAAQDRGAVARRDDAPGLRLPAGDAGDARSDAPAHRI